MAPLNTLTELPNRQSFYSRIQEHGIQMQIGCVPEPVQGSSLSDNVKMNKNSKDTSSFKLSD